MAEPARPPFRADHVGSLIRPKDARQAGIPEAEDLRFGPLSGSAPCGLGGAYQQTPARGRPRVKRSLTQIGPAKDRQIKLATS